MTVRTIEEANSAFRIAKEQVEQIEAVAKARGVAKTVAAEWSGFKFEVNVVECPNCRADLRRFAGGVFADAGGIMFLDKSAPIPNLNACPVCRDVAVAVKGYIAKAIKDIVDEYRLEKKKSFVAERFARSGVGDRFSSRRLENFFASKSPDAYDRAVQYCAAFDKFAAKGIGLYLFGSTGSGKTHLAAGIAARLIETSAVDVRFFGAVDLLDALRAEARGKYDDNTFNAAVACDLLVIDDFGKEYRSGEAGEWPRQRLYSIVNARYEASRPIIVTSELDLEGLSRGGYRAIASRLAEICRAIKTGDTDFRMSGMK